MEMWAPANSTKNAGQLHQEDEEDDEALSLSDLPLIHQWNKHEDDEEQIRPPTPREIKIQDDFDFCSMSKQSEMCSADELFFKGQILPMRHSVSSDKGLLLSRSESMDRFYSGGLISSRSSSISSHHSMSSSSGSSAATLRRPKYNPKLPPRNQFHSHPSPSPKLHFPTNKQRIGGRNQRNCPTKSSPWSIFRLGLVTTPPEIAFQDLKTRCPSKNNSTNSRNFGSRNSTSSNSSNNSDASKKKKKKKKKSMVLPLLGGCKCSADAVDTVSSRVVIIKRSASEGDVEALQHEPERAMTKKRAAKKHLSHHRTFEWLKQLSLEGAPDEA